MKEQVNEIDIIKVLGKLVDNRGFIIKFVAIFIVLGLVVAFTSPKEWSTKNTLFLSSAAANSGGGLGSFARLAGLRVQDNGNNSISPLAYTDIVKSSVFIDELLNSRFYLPELQDSVRLEDYLVNDLKPSPLGRVMGLPGTVMGWFRGSKDKNGNQPSFRNNEDFLFLSPKEKILHGLIKQRMLVTFDEVKLTVQIGFEIQDPFLAAQVTDKTVNYLSDYLKNYEQTEIRRKHQFIQNELATKKENFEKAQARLAEFKDSNLLINTNRGKSEQQKLQSDYDLSLELYTTLARNFEEVKIELNKINPIFDNLGLTEVPAKPSGPNRKLILVIFVLAGTVMSVMWLYTKDFIARYKESRAVADKPAGE